MKKVMSRGNGRLAERGHGRRARHTLIVALAGIAVTCSLASAAPASEVDGNHRPSVWGSSSDVPSGSERMLERNGGVVADGTNSELRIGLCLIALGGFALVLALAMMPRKPRRNTSEPHPPTAWRDAWAQARMRP